MVLTGHKRDLVLALRRRPRASYATLAAEVGLDERTVRRTIARLREDGALAFSATPIYEHLPGYVVAQVELRCRANAIETVARVVAERSDARFVAVTTGTADVVAEIVAPSTQALHSVLTSELGQIDGVWELTTRLSVDVVLTAMDWHPDGHITEVRRRAIEGAQPVRRPSLDEIDIDLIRVLGQDARMPLTAIAEILGVHESTVNRRLARLLESETVRLRADVEPAALGYEVESRFSLSVRPTELPVVLQALAAEPAMRALSVTTGAQNVLGYAVTTSTGDARAPLDRSLAHVDGLLGYEVSVVLRAYKRTGTAVQTDQ